MKSDVGAVELGTYISSKIISICTNGVNIIF